MPTFARRDDDDMRSRRARSRWWLWLTWLQFSTRSLLLLLVIASFGALYLRHALRDARQREALARLAKTASVTTAEHNGAVIELRLRFPYLTTLDASDFDGIDLLSDLEQLTIDVDYLSAGALEPLRSCPRLSELQLIGELPDRSLSNLPPTSHVSSFTINRTSRDSPKEAIRIVTRWQNLRKFTLQGIGEDPTLLDVASPENSIVELRLVGATPARTGAIGFEEVVLQRLSNWRNLRSLELLCLKLRGEVDSPSLSKLDRLSVAHCDSAESSLEGLVQLPELRFIRLWNCLAKPPQIGIALAGPKLVEFELLSLDADGKALAGLANARALERLKISLNLADDAMLRSLDECPTIQEVELVNLAGEKTLPNVKRVRHVEQEIDRILRERRKL